MFAPLHVCCETCKPEIRCLTGPSASHGLFSELSCSRRPAGNKSFISNTFTASATGEIAGGEVGNGIIGDGGTTGEGSSSRQCMSSCMHVSDTDVCIMLQLYTVELTAT